MESVLFLYPKKKTKKMGKFRIHKENTAAGNLICIGVRQP